MGKTKIPAIKLPDKNDELFNKLKFRILSDKYNMPNAKKIFK